MKTILVATDFSSAALNAANYAADMAIAINANLLLLHTYQIPVAYSEVPVAVNLEDMQQNAEKDLNSLKFQLLQHREGKLHLETEARMGIFFQELNAVCEREHPYCVVMGSQGTTAAERVFFGGHTIYATKHLTWPLITVPPGASFKTLKRIGLACDYKNVVDETPVEEIKSLVSDFNAELHILNTGKKASFDPNEVFESGLLQEMLVSLKPVYHFIASQDLDEGIMDFAEKNDIDLLIVLPKRHSFLEKVFKKSHTKRFVLHSHVPVMALHQQHESATL